MHKITIEVVNWEGEGSECDLCGWNENSGVEYLFNGKLFWETSRTGCYGSHQTDIPFVDALVDELFKYAKETDLFDWIVQETYLDEFKLEWVDAISPTLLGNGNDPRTVLNLFDVMMTELFKDYDEDCIKIEIVERSEFIDDEGRKQ